MGKINLLDFQVANLIAAGEVVERPASAVKELLENAIDAGAKNITVEIKRGGVAFIRVTDDGGGISKDDMPVAIMRHATSKIKDASDLDGIATLGFRGEALAAIASVSHLRIMSRTKGRDVGTVLESQAGEVLDISESGMPKGTTVIVEELFANVPARRKFLKRDASEAMACTAVVEKTALAHPEIAIKFISDGSMRFATSGDGKLKNTIYTVLGREFASKLTEVRDMNNGISVHGFISRPDNIRSNRNFENFFINGRYVKSRTAMSALEQAYESFIPGDKFPCCVLNIDIHPTFVDVNVHPTKLEVKFSNERLVFDAVYAATRNALMRKLDRPEVNLASPSVSAEDIALASAFVPIFDHKTEPPKERFKHAAIFDPQFSPPANEEADFASQAVSKPSADTLSVESVNLTRETPEEIRLPEIPIPEFVGSAVSEPPARAYIPPIREQTKVAHPEPEPECEEPQEIEKPQEIRYRLIGQAFNSYVFVEHEDKLLMIDKHAAHERILFEQMKRNIKKGGGEAQMLLVPIDLVLDPNGYSAIAEHKDDIEKLGFSFDMFDAEHRISLNGYPVQLDESEATELIDELCDRLANGTGTVDTAFTSMLESALYQASCKAAIKAGHIEDQAHIKWICDNLLALPDIKFCPHGRPVAMEMSINDIEKQFKRK
ncbi:MAG: DNA mismatch repair endonuclease MutL [Clostridia bacterium]|nr:DNA mismatch repair endonuclease MutL [Clostridia bacterium]